MICPICHKKMMEKKASDKLLYYCDYCNFLTKGESLEPILERKRYDNHICDSSYLEYMEGVYSKIKEYIKPNLALDFGCGKIHALADILVKNGFDCDYYDKYYFSELPTKKYDTIILIEVIEHILYLNELFEKLASLLNSKGRLIIMTNFIPESIDNWWYLRDNTHVNFYSLKAFLELKKKYNYKLIYSDNSSLVVLEKND